MVKVDPDPGHLPPHHHKGHHPTHDPSKVGHHPKHDHSKSGHPSKPDPNGAGHSPLKANSKDTLIPKPRSSKDDIKSQSAPPTPRTKGARPPSETGSEDEIDPEIEAERKVSHFYDR